MKELTNKLKSLPLATRLLLLAFTILVIAVIVMGLDNVPGIIAGMTAATCLIVEFSRRWRRIRSFIFLAFGSVIFSILISGLYYEVALPMVVRLGGESILTSPGWLVYHNIVSYGILLFCPGCVGVGLVGAIVKLMLRLRSCLQRETGCQTT
jgi:hypothetical protein